MHRMHQKFTSTVLALYVILGCWKGYVALFDQGSTEPKQIFHTQVDTLPQADQAALAEGIVVRNQRDLQMLLEDYLS